MYDPLGLSIGTTNLVAVRSGKPPVSRRAVLTLFPDRAPELGLPEKDSAGPDVDDTGTLMTGFVERVGGSTTLKSADGTSHDPSLLLVEALDALISETGGDAATSNITMAVPAHWGSEALQGMQAALNTHADFVHGGIAPRIVPDSVAALTALNSDSRLPGKGVVALLDFGGGGTSITLADAASDFTPIGDTLRYEDFSGDLVDQALMLHALDSAGPSSGADPADTAVVGQFAGLREECRLAKERLSTEDTTELALDLPGRRTRLEISRAEFDSLIEERLDGVFAAFDDMLRRNKIRSKDLAAVAMAGGTAKIPVVAQRLSSHTKTSVITAIQPGLATAVGAVKLSTRRPIEQRDGAREETTMASLVGASTGGFATSTSGLATTGHFLAPTGALEHSHRHVRCIDGHVRHPDRRRAVGRPVGTADPAGMVTGRRFRRRAGAVHRRAVRHLRQPRDSLATDATAEVRAARRGPGARNAAAAAVPRARRAGLDGGDRRSGFHPDQRQPRPDAAQQQHHGATAAAAELATPVAERGAATAAQRGTLADRCATADQRGAAAASAASASGDV